MDNLLALLGAGVLCLTLFSEPIVSELTHLEHAVLRKLLAGEDERLAVLRKQSEMVMAGKREMTGVGFYTTLSLTVFVDRLDDASFVFGDVVAEIPGLTHGAGFLLYVRNGLLDFLEGFTYGDDAWPEHISTFELYYRSSGHRDLDTLISQKIRGDR